LVEKTAVTLAVPSAAASAVRSAEKWAERTVATMVEWWVVN
jgi:hypothetical protein